MLRCEWLEFARNVPRVSLRKGLEGIRRAVDDWNCHANRGARNQPPIRSVGRRGALDQMRSLILLDTSTLLKTSTGMYGVDYKYTILSPVKTYNVRRFKFIIDSALEEMLLFN
jgi:hypothetical protein